MIGLSLMYLSGLAAGITISHLCNRQHAATNLGDNMSDLPTASGAEDLAQILTPVSTHLTVADLIDLAAVLRGGQIEPARRLHIYDSLLAEIEAAKQ